MTTLRILGIALLVALTGAATAQPEAAASYQLVVHAANPAESLSKEQVSKLFLKKTTMWPDGTGAEPVDLEAGSAVREAFSQDVHGRAVSAIRAYWQKLVFSGREVPPPEYGADAEVIEFVRSTPGAIGYVSGAVSADGVKAVSVSE